MDDIEFANEDGEFELSDGSWGNPGCECGENDAVVYIDGEYLCESGYDYWMNEQSESK